MLSAVGCVYRWELRDASGVDVQSGTEDVEIVWDEISLQDIVEQAHAELYRAQAEKLTAEQEETT